MKGVFFFLGELNDQDINWLIAKGRKLQLESGTSLVQEGKRLDQMYIILEGVFNLTVASKAGPEEVARFGAGGVIGEISFVDSRPPSGTVRAVTAAVVLSVPSATLVAKLREDPGFAARFYRGLAMMLAYRLRVLTARKVGEADASAEPPDQLDMNVLDTVHLAGARFNRILERLLSA